MWASSWNNGFQKKFFEILYTCKHTIEQSMRSVKVHRVVGFKQKQWLSEEVFQNIIHIQTYNWTKYALSESTVSDGLQSEAMAFGRSFSKHYTHSNIQLIKVWAFWKYTEWLDSSRNNGFQKKFSKTLYIFKQTIEQSMRSLKVHLAAERGLQSEAMAFRVSFLKHYTHSNIQLIKVCALWNYAEWWASSRSNSFQKKFLKYYTHSNIRLNKVCALWNYDDRWASRRSNGFQTNFFETLYTFKHTI